MPIAEIVKTLGVAYVLDGIRADNGYIVWTETYDRPVNDGQSLHRRGRGTLIRSN